MGACRSKNFSFEEYRQSTIIDETLHNTKAHHFKTVTILALGAGDTGKSTFAKQMKILYLNAFKSDKESCLEFVPWINREVITGMVKLIIGAITSNTKLSPRVESHFRPFQKLDMTEAELEQEAFLIKHKLTPELAEAVTAIWEDIEIKTLFHSKKSLLGINDCAAYFFEKVHELTKVDYVPCLDDILRVRVPTIGVAEVLFPLHSKVMCRLIDVGGQRSQRRKWIHYFQDVTAVLFFASLSEYDMPLTEDNRVNRLEESLMLFKEICSAVWFRKSSIILFLNKYDVFREKLEHGKSLTLCFPDYNGGLNVQAAASYVSNKFTCREINTTNRSIYVHFTVATDTENVRLLLNSIKDLLLTQQFASIGL